MKKSILISTLLVLVAFIAYAQNNVKENSGDFYENILLTEELQAEAGTGIAKDNARQMLKSKPQILQLKDDKVVSRPNRSITSKPNIAEKNYGAAPFGLVWGDSMKRTQTLGVIMTPVGEKDYVNNFSLSHLPKSVNDFRDIRATFGIENELWRIIAYGKFIKDDAKASNVLKLYNTYYKLLTQKYGNPQQFYTPKVTNVDTIVDLGGGKSKTITETKEEVIGGKNFLQELQSGEAELYSTFDNSDVGAALSVNVDGNGQSYIVIDYKNLKILQHREDQTLQAL